MRRALVSVVVPCFNEQEGLGETHRRLTGALRSLDADHEILYVNDGSKDGTIEVLRGLHAADPSHVRVVDLSRNFGHQLAVTAGIDHAAGDAVVLIDADLQDPPELIATFVKRWREGYKVVYGVREERQGESAFKRWTASRFYRLLNRLSDVPIPLDTGDFRLMDRVAVDALRRMGEQDRFIRGMVSWVGYRQIPVTYTRGPRFAGESNYRFLRMLKFGIDGIASFSISPLKLVTWLGGAVSVFAAFLWIYALVLRLVQGVWVPGWTLLLMSTLLIGGIQMLALGVLGEYVGRIYREAKRRPLYLVQDALGFDDADRTKPAPAAVAPIRSRT